MGIQIETGRLILRQFEENDAQELNDICNEPNILKWMPDWQSSFEFRREWIKRIQKQYSPLSKEKLRVLLAVTLKDSGTMVGMVTIGNKEEVDNEIEIKYFISEKYSNRGYMTEAAKAMIRWAFEDLGLGYLIAIVEPDNHPSQRVVEKCGFVKKQSRMILNSGESEEKLFYYYRLYNR